MGALFPGEAGGGGRGGGGAPGEEVGVEFRCGRMVAEGGSARADPRRGLFRVLRGADGLVHAQWLERPGGSAPPRLEEDCDLIVFPGEAQVRRVGPAQARAFDLSFQQPGRSLMFWMQEPAAKGSPGADANRVQEETAAADELLWEEVHSALGNSGEGPAAKPSLAAHPSGEGVATPGGGAEGGATPATAAAPEVTPAAPGAPARGGSLAPSPGPGAGAGGNPQLAAALLAGVMAGRAERGPSLAEVLRPETLLPLLANPEVQEQVRPYLPQEHRSAEDITRLATSPQFREQLEVFSCALQSGQLDLQQFGLEAAGFSAAEFLQGIESMVAKQREEDSRPEDSMDQD